MVRRRKRLFSDEFGPFGLGALLNNEYKKDEKMRMLKEGIVDDGYIFKKYKDMLGRVNGGRSPLMENDETGEIATFPIRSRWNSEYDYGWRVREKMSRQVMGLRSTVHMVLTVHPPKLESIIPSWWVYSDKIFLAVFGGYIVRRFLMHLRNRKKSRGERWNFIGWSMEFTKQGYAHWHMLFMGRYIAPIDEIVELWGLCERQGVDIKAGVNGGARIASYLCKYISKSLQLLPLCSEPMIPAFMYYFNRRLYNLRHDVKKIKDVERYEKGGDVTDGLACAA